MAEKKRILVILSQIRKSLEHEWFADMINRHGRFEIHFAMINARESHLDRYIKERGYQVYNFEYHSSRSIPSLTFELYRIMRKNRYDVVHAHLFEAYVCGMTAAKLAGVKKRIITRHHSDLHHTWHPHAVKYDKWINALSTDIVAISGVVEEILIKWEQVAPSKVHLIPHGIDTSFFQKTNALMKRAADLRAKYKISDDSKVIGVISRLTEWKGVQFILPAFEKLLAEQPSAVLFIANATGDYSRRIHELATAIPSSNIRFVEFEEDVSALYHMFDVFVHIPISRESEAFGQVYVEALASELPCVFTLSGVACDFAIDRVNCILVPYMNPDATFQAISLLLMDAALGSRVARQGMEDVSRSYHINNKISKLEALYLA